MVFSKMKNLTGSCFTVQTSAAANAPYNPLKCPHAAAGAVPRGMAGVANVQKEHGISTCIKILGRFDYEKMEGASAVTVSGGEERAC